MKPRTHKPRRSLITLFVLLLLAAACGAGYLVLTLEGTKNDRMSQRIEEVFFLNAALQLPYTDQIASINESKPDYIGGSENEPTMFDMYGESLLLANEDGSLLDTNSTCANTYHSNKVYVQWNDGIACFMYNEEVLMAVKYNVIVYDRTHLYGGAVARGSFGYAFKAAGTLEEKLLNMKVRSAECMRIFIDTDWSGNKRYLVSLPPSVVGTSDELTNYDIAWRKEAKNLLGIGAPLFLALYWLGLAYWVYLDARRRMMRADAWTIAVFVTNLAGFTVYMLAARARARREAVKICPACGGRALRAFPCCPWCGAPQGKRCPACGGEMKDGWTVCPHCDGTLRAAEPEPQKPVETPAAVPAPFAVPPALEEAPEPEQEEEPAIPLIFQDGSPFNRN